MIPTERYRAVGGGDAQVNLAPLIDMMFILLIFFLVTTQFISETGLEIDRPRAAASEQAPDEAILIGVSADGAIYMDRRPVSLHAVRGTVRERLRKGDVPVVIVADRDARTQTVVDVMDECTLAGAKRISLATEQE